MLQELGSSFEGLELGVEVSAKDVPELRRKLLEAEKEVKKQARQLKEKRYAKLKDEFKRECQGLDTSDNEGGRRLEEKYKNIWKGEEVMIDKQAERELMVRTASFYKALDVINTTLLREDRKLLQKKLHQSNHQLNDSDSRLRAMEIQLKEVQKEFEAFRSDSQEKYEKLKREASNKVSGLSRELIRVKAQLDVYKSQVSANAREILPSGGGRALGKKICPFFLQGECKYGADCLNVHDARYTLAQGSIGKSLSDSKMDSEWHRQDTDDAWRDNWASKNIL